MGDLGFITRRDVLVGGAALGAAMAIPGGVFASGKGAGQIKVGLIGCGGRGSGAISDAARAEGDVVLWAMGDVFRDRLDGAYNNLSGALKERCQVTPDRRFTGFDAYQKVLETGVDVVILTTPPAFRPTHLNAAIQAGKHVFMEKPVATDAPGIRSVFESGDLALKMGLNIVAGTQRRHDVAYREAIKRIHDGQIGDVVATYAYWNQGGLWMNPRQDSWSDMEWQLRNWLYFTWLSGDHIVEQHVHNLDVCNWVKGKMPIKATSLAGRQVRTDSAYGHIFDHFATEYEYDDGAKMISMCRQIDNTASRVAEHVVGTKGSSDANSYIKGKDWKFKGDRPNPYVEEHRHLYEAIKGGKTINEARQVAESTLTAIMGRMSAYSGQEISWQQALNSQESLVPSHPAMGAIETPPVAVPGRTAFR